MPSVELIQEQLADKAVESARPSQQKTRAFWFVVLALAVRIGLLVWIYGIPFAQPRAQQDWSWNSETANIGASIATGHGFSSPMLSVVDGDPKMGPSAWIGPIYPLLCAASFWLFRPFSSTSFFFIFVIQSIISAATCVPILRLGELTTGRRTGQIAAFLWAVFPWFSKWAITWVWEICLSALLASWLIWFVLRLEDDSKRSHWIWWGALWGFALLTNPALATLLVFSGLWLAYRRIRAGREWFKLVVFASVTCIAVISPWLIRNRIVFGQWVFIRDNFWFEFSLANYPDNHDGRGWGNIHPNGRPEALAEYQRLGELEFIRTKAKIGHDFVRQHTKEFVAMTGKRIIRFWDGSDIIYSVGIPTYWLPQLFGLFSILMVPSLILFCAKRVRGWSLFLGSILVYPLPYYITHGQLRYRHVLEPLMLLIVVYAIGDTVARFLPKKSVSAH